jgi:L-cystine transport system substrate-binding protein
MSSKLIATVALSLTALTLTACGSGGTSGSTGGSASSGSSAAASGGVLRVGTEGTYSPFSFHDPKTNDLTGYDVDVITAVGKDLGMKVQFSEVQWDAIFAGMEAGRYDVIANQVSVTPERQAKYDFSTPYTVSGGAILTRTDDTSVTSVASLKGKTTAQSSTSNWAQVAKDAGANVESVEGFTQAVALLKQGRVDATVNDELAVRNYLATTKDKSVKIAGAAGEKTEQAVALPKGSKLTPKVDKALADLQSDGTLAKISDKWFGSDVTH